MAESEVEGSVMLIIVVIEDALAGSSCWDKFGASSW